MTVRLNSDQQAALEAVKRGENIFLTGPAGSGKSTLVAAIVHWAQRTGKVCDVTAMTGCAALLLGNKAKTLHSWAGIGLGKGTAEQLATEILRSPFAKKRWKRAHILVIDEISMMSPDLFEKLSQVGKRVRGGSQAWGGLQLILCGDFYQLPPVSRETQTIGKFAFDAPAWKAANLQPVVLTRIERQTDKTFQKLLNEARVGNLSEESVGILKSRQGLDWKEQRIRPTLLFSRNADVEDINEKNVAALNKPMYMHEAKTIVGPPKDADASVEIPTGEFLERLVQRMDADASYVAKLELCEGCQVMLVWNMDMEKGLVNGSRGVVVGFRPDGIPIVQFLHGDPIPVELHEWTSNDCPALRRQQIPLRVAYALTIHKSQGATLDCALVDIGSSTFECGQAYVALSRVRGLESLYIHNFNPARVMADAKVVQFYDSLLTPLLDKPEEPMPPVPPPTPAIQSPCASQVDLEEAFSTATVATTTATTATTATTSSVETIPTETTVLTETVAEVVDIAADLDLVTRVPVTKTPKVVKPRAPRKKKEAVEVVGNTEVTPATPATPATPTTKPRAPRKKKEVVEVVGNPENAEEAPTKKPKAPRKKKEV
jgi:ATP-dependent DNA helicase PIF1